MSFLESLFRKNKKDPPSEIVLPPAASDRPRADWDHLPTAKEWTTSLVNALNVYGQNILADGPLPGDASDFCKSELHSKEGKIKLYVALISSMARFESSFNPRCAYAEDFNDIHGKPVVSMGLLQVSKESANGYGAGITNELSLYEPAINFKCAVLILNRWVKRDGCIAMGKNGGARYWSVLRGEQREQIAARSRALTS